MSSPELAVLADQEYLRQRLQPTPGDGVYLHLSDLLLAMERFRCDDAISILDLGCGGSPYRSLFPNSVYKRADIAEVEDTDFVIPTDGSPFRLPVDDDQFDIVLSSQVLEHVPEPGLYLAEACRMLKPGGKLLLSTHGVFEEHGCPYDFRRWTSFGLRLELENAGLRVDRMLKLTTGCRAALFLLQRHRRPVSRKHTLGWWMWWMHWMQHKRREKFDRQCDAAFPECRVVSDTETNNGLYIGLFAVAVKPS